ncbi:unnamed protein product [Chilo suppressalis]|uniref:Uncharacterized protein n=1 Tax=Chilo suppressalis TaxID=168631 RepID=A0ABN8L897_CHISP|nr:unnamed protein product [Chilo suppressalis]
MMVFKSIVFFALCILGAVHSAVLPIEKCNLEDSACMVASFQKAVPVFMEGLPDLGIQVLDVLEMDPIQFDLSGLQFKLTDGRLKGLKGAIIDSVKWNPKKKKIAIEFHANSTVKGHYTAGGRILILPITGDGQITMKLKHIAVKITVDYETEQDGEGKNHIVPKKLHFDFEVKDGAHFTLTNLFNGNKELSDAMHLFLNDNWKQISAEFGRPIMASAANSIYKNIITFFKKMPIDDISLSS